MVENNNDPIYNAIHTISIIRRFLLINGQAIENQYRGIRVLLWLNDWRRDNRRTVEVLVECDDQYVERSNSVESRLQAPIIDVSGPLIYDATDIPPPYVQPLPPPPPPDHLQRTDWDKEEDENNPSILGP